MSRALYPQLDEVSEHEYDYAVSFHGTCTENVKVGGQAPRELRIGICEAINDVLTDTDVYAELGREGFRTDDDATLVNRLSTHTGVWIGQSKSVRETHGTEIVDAVADVLRDQL
ncbi:hypothetical protein [Halalkalicoccus tibetensis]|uniref:Uncharacterized protein n=1 Tax=Halalkalicoccus tibetensis TaxID=175632 RepID=A0ABD5V8T5_9EURY